jgi:membrane-bound inhibitor of C-type lysozyme
MAMSKNFRRVLAAGFAALAFATPTSAADVTLMLDAPKAEALSINYRCEGTSATMTVEYINAGEDSLAMVPVEGGRRVMVSVLAASGARYAGGAFVWWTKGREGSLYDLRNGEDADPVTTCVEAE